MAVACGAEPISAVHDPRRTVDTGHWATNMPHELPCHLRRFRDHGCSTQGVGDTVASGRKGADARTVVAAGYRDTASTPGVPQERRAASVPTGAIGGVGREYLRGDVAVVPR